MRRAKPSPPPTFSGRLLLRCIGAHDRRLHVVQVLEFTGNNRCNCRVVQRKYVITSVCHLMQLLNNCRCKRNVSCAARDVSGGLQRVRRDSDARAVVCIAAERRWCRHRHRNRCCVQRVEQAQLGYRVRRE